MIHVLLQALVEALPTVILGAGVVGLLSLARMCVKDARRARRFAATVRQLREAGEPAIPTVVINQYRPASIEGSRLGAHLGRCVERLQRAEAMLEAGDDQDARHELRAVIRHLVGIQTEYAPAKSVGLKALVTVVLLLLAAAPAYADHWRFYGHERVEHPGVFPEIERELRDAARERERDYREFKQRQELEDVKRRLNEIERTKPEGRGR